jgi:hypothetical protein
VAAAAAGARSGQEEVANGILSLDTTQTSLKVLNAINARDGRSGTFVAGAKPARCKIWHQIFQGH